MAVADGLRAALRRRTVLASAIALIGLGPARAYDEIDMVDLKVVDRATGQTLPIWRHDGRLFVAGEQGARYSLRITNHTDGRVLVVLSVDGVNIISGETATYGQRGYVLGPYGSYDLKGWRKSETEVAAFAFTALPNSYAAQTGRPGDVGVIGMAVFKERPAVTPLAVSPAPEPAPRQSNRFAPSADAVPPPPLPLPPVEKPLAKPNDAAAGAAGKSAESVVVTGSRIQRRDYPSSVPAPAVAQNPPEREAKLGTAHGAIEWSVSHQVPFARATAYPQLIRQIEYDSHANLLLAGVIPSPPGPGRPPRAFPSSGAAPGFVPDPPARF